MSPTAIERAASGQQLQQQWGRGLQRHGDLRGDAERGRVGHGDLGQVQRVRQGQEDQAVSILRQILELSPSHVASQRVVLAARVERRAAGRVLLHFEVSDSGPGISPELAARLYQPFSAGNVHQGSGLGLAICREITQALGGSISLDNREQHSQVVGLDATIRLPLFLAAS
mgnify:CR=1 FL=1